jgi:ATP-dependent DNA helicase PIF1
MTQAEALEILKMGHNAFVTGAAGSGKTHLLNSYIKYLRDNDAHLALGITASTGIAATHMGGMTIHAWSGLGIRDKLDERDIDDLEERQYLWKRFEKAKVLIIDEVSMLHHFRLDLVERIARAFKRNEEPFGGMQVILCGDFFQLPPVSRSNEPKAQFIYHSKSWKALDLKMCYLEDQYRQSDKDYLEILNAVRDNAVSEDMIDRLKTRFREKEENEVQVGDSVSTTRLHSHNADVDMENDRELGNITGTTVEYLMSSSGFENLVEALKKSCLAPEKLRLKKGARVMFVKNNFEEGYANGTLGIVEDCNQLSIKVKTLNGRIIQVPKASWRIDDGGKVLAEIEQYPLRLAWAITVHKSQGMSLDSAEVDLSKSFEKGMGYVALSRVRTLGGLTLLGLNHMALAVNPEVLSFDKKFREESAKHVKELHDTHISKVSDRQKAFLATIAPVNGKKIKKVKPETTEETKRLIGEKLSLKKIADERGLKVETILSHLEKMQKADPAFDFSYLKKEIPAVKLKKIIAAFAKAANEEGTHPLAPVKYALGAGFSFEEIRLARLFL